MNRRGAIERGRPKSENNAREDDETRNGNVYRRLAWMVVYRGFIRGRIVVGLPTILTTASSRLRNNWLLAN